MMGGCAATDRDGSAEFDLVHRHLRPTLRFAFLHHPQIVRHSEAEAGARDKKAGQISSAIVMKRREEEADAKA